jgi:hypothetical protein
MSKRRTKAEIAAAKLQAEHDRQAEEYGPPPDPWLMNLRKAQTPASKRVAYTRAKRLWPVVKSLASEMVGGYPPNDYANLKSIIRELDRYMRRA